MQLSDLSSKLHIFADASLITYGAIAFICVDGDNDQS